MFYRTCPYMRMPDGYIASCSDLKERLLKALKGEQDARRFYSELVKLAKYEEDKKIITEITLDERKHFNNFRRLYIELTGKEPALPPQERPVIKSYIEGLKTAIMDETEAYEFYRDTFLCTNNPIGKQIFLEAFTDENEHAIRLNYLFTKNK